MKHIARLLLAVALVGAVQSSAVGVAAAAQSSPGAQFLSLVNKERAGRGLAPLTLEPGLSSVAGNWTSTMVSSKGCSRGVAHNPDYGADVPEGWTSIAENVGCAASVTSLHNMLMRSSAHRANILGDFNAIGIGVSGSRGAVWITQIFATYPRHPG